VSPAALASDTRPMLAALFGGAVQRGATPGAGPVSDGPVVHAAASRGVATSATALPYADQIQRSFGHHDVSSIQAHVGAEAAASARSMDARAYASGHHVVFNGAPDLHTTAHEAAHVVQQRGGVQLKGGVGQQGDSYEQHADAVADMVVAGRSAEALLTQMTPSAQSEGAAGGAIQRLPETYVNETDPKKRVCITESGNVLLAKGIAYGDWAKLEIGVSHNGDLVLHEIEAHPPEGSNLGALLVYHLAEKAKAKGQTAIEIDAAAATARGFYKAMGFGFAADLLRQMVADDNEFRAVEKIAGMREMEGFAVESAGKAPLLAAIPAAKNMMDIDTSDPKVRKAFNDICVRAASSELEATFPALKGLELLARVQYLLRLKKLEIATPMVGKTDDVMHRAWESMLKKWNNAAWGERGYFIGEKPEAETHKK
jgi:hypothetical protein